MNRQGAWEASVEQDLRKPERPHVLGPGLCVLEGSFLAATNL